MRNTDATKEGARMTPDELTAIRHRWSNYAGRKLPIQTAWADVEALLTALTEAEALAERLALDRFAREIECELLRAALADRDATIAAVTQQRDIYKAVADVAQAHRAECSVLDHALIGVVTRAAWSSVCGCERGQTKRDEDEIEASMADDRNDDAWLEDRGLL